MNNYRKSRKVSDREKEQIKKGYERSESYYKGLLGSIEMKLSEWFKRNRRSDGMIYYRDDIAEEILNAVIKPQLELHGVDWKLDNEESEKNANKKF